MSNRKRQVFHQLLDEVRRSQTATARYDQAVADAVGLNRTDMRCLDIIEREEPVTAGRLADVTGLTSGAITTVLDRLERSGYARRVRDAADRRRVLVEVTPKTREEVNVLYAGHAVLAARLYERYKLEELEMLLEFVRGSREFNEEQAALLEERTRRVRG